MFFGIAFLVLTTSQPYETYSLRVCVPNTYFVLNSRLCLCNLQGGVTEADCKNIAQRQTCPPGQIIWQGCNQCICQDNGQFLCTSAYCVTNPGMSYHGLAKHGPRCMPFRSYYVNCSLCFCPATGQAADAQCTVDASCSLDQTPDMLTITKRNHCIPNVMYLFPCIQCLCSEFGFFVLDKCLEKCQSQTTHKRRCIAGTLYRKDCDICRCPDNGIPDDMLCIKTEEGCNANTMGTYLHSLRSTSNHCVPNTFTKPKCVYCECSSKGTVNEHSCLELDCSQMSNFKNYAQTGVCNPGELVPICMQCFCLNNGLINETYCTRICTYQSKLNVIEKVLNDSQIDLSLINKTSIKTVGRSETCESNTIYLDNGKYCLCSENGDTNNKFCTSVIEDLKYKQVETNKFNFDVTTRCVPNTLVDFECNTCYCSKTGKIDLKWCTYDDCEAKRIVMESHKSRPTPEPIEDPGGICVPGSISKLKCNLCICPDSGILRERACTKNECLDNVEVANDKFTCEPLSYYEVDCNVCFCPRDGLKNVAKCTKNECEKSFLRSESCGAGLLFSDECNVCICPPNGNKADKVCTNNTCAIPRWNNLKLTNSLSENQIHDDATRNLDLCFPGEEFSMGCNLCVCPDLGLKVYATCEPILCDEKVEDSVKATDVNANRMQNLGEATTQLTKRTETNARIRRDIHDNCYVYNISHSAERKECTPGTMYIIRCKQCICPYMGNINNFCRPLPKTFFCEEAYPGFNFLVMGRRKTSNRNTTKQKLESKADKKSVTMTVKHLKHTTYKCDRPGKVMDECFICECENNTIIEEHCFKSDAKNCTNVIPTFFDENKALFAYLVILFQKSKVFKHFD